MFFYGKRIVGLFLIIIMSPFCGQRLSAMWPFCCCTKQQNVCADTFDSRRVYMGEVTPMRDLPADNESEPAETDDFSRALSAPVGTNCFGKASMERGLSVPAKSFDEARPMVKKIEFDFSREKTVPTGCCCEDRKYPKFVSKDGVRGLLDYLTFSDLRRYQENPQQDSLSLPIYGKKSKLPDLSGALTFDNLARCVAAVRAKYDDMNSSTAAHYGGDSGSPALVYEADDLLFPISEKQLNFSWISELCSKQGGSDYIFIVKRHSLDCNELKDALRANGIVRGCIYCLSAAVNFDDAADIALWRKEIEHTLKSDFFWWHFCQISLSDDVMVSFHE